MKRPLLAFTALLLVPVAALPFAEPGVSASAAPAKQLPLPGEVFLLAGHTAFLVPAKSEAPASAKAWVWYSPTLPDLPGQEEQWMFERFCDAGIAIAGIDVGESYGSPAGRRLFTEFYGQMTGSRGYSRKPVLLGRSRGGLMALSWAVENADKVAGFAGIYPVCNLASYPGVAQAAGAYAMKADELQARLIEHNPIDRLAALAKGGVPLFAIHGDADEVVPLEDNSGLMKKRFTALGGQMELIVPTGQGHNMWPGFFQSQELVDFVKSTVPGQEHGFGHKVALVRAGQPQASIVVAKAAGHIPCFAAGELQYHVQKITGATLPILTDDAEIRGPCILVGASRRTEALGLRNVDFKPQEYLIGFRRDTLVLMGRDPEDELFPVRVTVMTNHSFYDFYDRFWEKNPQHPELFEGRRLEYWAKGYQNKPPQLCYTSPQLIAQVVKDARAKLDQGADYVQLVPMDNDQQCRCANCQALLDRDNKSRQFSTGKASALFWTFANAVARAVRQSHPDKFVGTIAYYDYAFPPPFDLEPNLLVGPCLHTRNWWSPAMERNDLAFYQGWVRKVPGRLHCVWLYQCFPDEIAENNHFKPFTGFHAHTLSRQFRMFARDQVRGIFLCGVASYIDGYLTFRCLDDPFFDVDRALDEFFTRYYGPAGAPMKQLYLGIEQTYMTPANYPETVQKDDIHFHQTEEMAWQYLGTAERMAAWAKLIEQAQAAAGTAVQKERVAVFVKDLWGNMLDGRK